MRILCVLLVGLFISAAAVQAKTVQAEEIAQDMSCKLNRGVFNILTGWGELPRQMIKSGKEKGWWAPVFVGIPAGALMTVVRTGTGIFETATFFIPIDDSYGPLIDPAFVWQKASE